MLTIFEINPINHDAAESTRAGRCFCMSLELLTLWESVRVFEIPSPPLTVADGL